MMAKRDAFIAYRALAGIQRIALRHDDINIATSMLRIVGTLEYRIFGSICLENMNCFFCDEPLTSDDYKLDRVEKAGALAAHKTCVIKEDALINRKGNYEN